MPDSVSRPLRVFLCHASEDKPIVRELHQRLKTEGWIDSWLDEDRLLLGEDWDMKIQKELESADIVIVFISEGAIRKAGYVQKELRLIYDISFYKPEDTIFVIPLRLEECQPPWRFRLWQWGDYFGEKKESTYQNLIQSLKRRYQQQLQSEFQERVKHETKNIVHKAEEKKITENLERRTRSENLVLQKLPHLHERDKRLPPLNILLADQNARPDERMINQTAGMIEKTLHDFGIRVIVIGFRIGPTVIQFAIQPGFRKKGSNTTEEQAQQLVVLGRQILSLQKDLELALSIEHLRIEAPVPGKLYIGIEVPNPSKTIVRMRPILESDVFRKMSAPLPVVLGRDISGQPVVADLVRMPHLVITGTTGSGKSVCIMSIVACLAMNVLPEDLHMVMIDSRMIELSRFNGLPHLYGKVETRIEPILDALRWLIVEMERRYELLEAAHVPDVEAYNRRVAITSNVPIPRIGVLIDGLADLMISAPKQIEQNLIQLLQMAHFTGIHLIVTTQRPFTDTVTALIKQNFPSRLILGVASEDDSRIILGTIVAESLLGRGEMLFVNPEFANPRRIQGVMISETEIEQIILYWQKTVDIAPYSPPWVRLATESEKNESDDLIEKAVSLVRKSQHVSASLLQRRLRIGYPRAARLLDQLEKMGVIGPSQVGKERNVLLGPIVNEPSSEKGGNVE